MTGINETTVYSTLISETKTPAHLYTSAFHSTEWQEQYDLFSLRVL